MSWQGVYILDPIAEVINDYSALQSSDRRLATALWESGILLVLPRAENQTEAITISSVLSDSENFLAIALFPVGNKMNPFHK